jgi:hypothetical protein
MNLKKIEQLMNYPRLFPQKSVDIVEDGDTLSMSWASHLVTSNQQRFTELRTYDATLYSLGYAKERNLCTVSYPMCNQ